ncbi:MAG: Sec-independent protein translocase protein TatB [Arcobacteraceae bacterium]|jgi:sec-independent protein translocase protein TatB|nr:Sec-independent protein translocase protein TatB [Arcobacteraceae bacterium]
MFGLGFMEIFVILVVAVIALGPEKLPSVAVDVAKFLKKLKAGIDDAKSTLDSELNISGLKEEATNLKSHVSLDRLANFDLDESTKAEIKPEPKKEEKIENKTKDNEVKA